MKNLLLTFALWFAVSGVAFAVVNINTATKEELMSLKGIGEKRAQEIINYRTKHGNFKSIDDLEKVPGIGAGRMKQIRSELTVTGKTNTDKAADKLGDAKAKGDAMKSDTAKAKVAEKSKADEKKPATK